MTSILEDLTTLPPRKLEKRLEQLAKDALPCLDVWAAGADRENGLTVALHVDARNRRDVTDLARVLREEPRCLFSSGWSVLEPSKRRSAWQLLLRVEFERPVHCEFVIRFDVTAHPGDPIRATLPLLLAASWLLLVTDQQADPDDPQVWFSAPPARESLVALIASAG